MDSCSECSDNNSNYSDDSEYNYIPGYIRLRPKYDVEEEGEDEAECVDDVSPYLTRTSLWPILDGSSIIKRRSWKKNLLQKLDRIDSRIGNHSNFIKL